MRFLPFYLCLFATIVTVAGCTKDSLPEPEPSVCGDVTPTYEMDVRQIIESSCAYSGCHLGGAPGLYNDYNGLLPTLDNGSFRTRVILQMADPNLGMPPDYAPTDRPQNLTAAELETITCWLEEGYPES